MHLKFDVAGFFGPIKALKVHNDYFFFKSEHFHLNIDIIVSIQKVYKEHAQK